MDKGIQAARRANAISAITSSLEVLAARHGLNPELVDAPKVAMHRDPGVSEVWRLEGIQADLEALVGAGQASPGEMDRQEVVAILEAQVGGLTKTSLAALQAWAQEGSEASNLGPEEA